ncbi:MAG: hypothetical protein Q4E41_06895 [Bacteroidales bacterium]|nr:hypothetical protein [Bacteroidales bacterium]
MDFENFCSYLEVVDKESNQALKDGCEWYFTFGKDKLRKLKKSIKHKYSIWVKDFSKNSKDNEPKWNVLLPDIENISKKNRKERFEILTSLYFTNCDSFISMGNNSQILVAPKGKEMEAIRSLQIEEKFVGTKAYNTRKFINWDVIKNNCQTCSDIIFVDLYAFSQEEIEFEKNAYQIILDICTPLNNSYVNIVFFTRRENNYNGIRYTTPVSSIIRNLKQRILDFNGCQANITFVLIKNEEHDRTIFTNFNFFDSGDTYMYFRQKEESSVSKGRLFHVNSYLDKDIYLLTKESLNDLQKLVDEKNRLLGGIMGDKICNFLDFG